MTRRSLACNGARGRREGPQGDIVNSKSDPGELGSLFCIFTIPPTLSMAIHYVPLGPLELRVSRTFLDQLRPQLLRPWIPSSTRCQHFLFSLGPFLAA